jgi:hypothetical protein
MQEVECSTASVQKISNTWCIKNLHLLVLRRWWAFPPLSIVDRGDTKIGDEGDGCERPDTLPSEKPPPGSILTFLLHFLPDPKGLFSFLQ